MTDRPDTDPAIQLGREIAPCRVPFCLWQCGAVKDDCKRCHGTGVEPGKLDLVKEFQKRVAHARDGVRTYLRDETIEQCARVAVRAEVWTSYRDRAPRFEAPQAAHDIAVAIRALKATT